MTGGSENTPDTGPRGRQARSANPDPSPARKRSLASAFANPRDWLALLVLALGVLFLVSRFWGEVYDDLLVTLRFSRNLAHGHGLTWNPGPAPTEGYTTTLWVLLMALPYLVGVEGLLAAKVTATASLLVVLGGLYAWGRTHGVDRLVLVLTLAALAFSPAVALLATQGMATLFAAVLVLGACWCSYRYLDESSSAAKAGLLAFNVGLFLVRPGLAVFAGGLVLATVAVWLLRGEPARARGFFADAFAWNAVPLAAFLLARRWYFGQWLPNSVHAKDAAGLVSLGAVEQTYFLAAILLGPALAFLGTLVLTRTRLPRKAKLTACLPMVTAASLFLAALLTIRPDQGDFARFQWPAIPALLMPLLLAAADTDLSLDRLGSGDSVAAWARGLVALGLAAVLVTAPLQTYTEARSSHQRAEDLEAAGKALAAFDPDEHRMLVTESGALPYYSDWRSVDWRGLTNTTIAKHGFQAADMHAFDPHVVQTKPDHPLNEHYPWGSDPAQDEGYVLAAAYQRPGPRDALNLYLVDEASPEAEALTCALATLPKGDPVPRQRALEVTEIPIEPAPTTVEECPST